MAQLSEVTKTALPRPELEVAVKHICVRLGALPQSHTGEDTSKLSAPETKHADSVVQIRPVTHPARFNLQKLNCRSSAEGRTYKETATLIARPKFTWHQNRRPAFVRVKWEPNFEGGRGRPGSHFFVQYR